MRTWKPTALITAALITVFSSEPVAPPLASGPADLITTSTLTVNIVGPSNVKPYATCLYEAQVEGGTPPYGYNWNSSEGDWSYNDHFWATASGGNLGFVVSLLVTDATGAQEYVTKNVRTSPPAPDCIST